MNKLILAVSLIAMTLSTVACNTFAGLGEDVQAGGRKLENTAERNK